MANGTVCKVLENYVKGRQSLLERYVRPVIVNAVFATITARDDPLGFESLPDTSVSEFDIPHSSIARAPLPVSSL